MLEFNTEDLYINREKAINNVYMKYKEEIVSAVLSTIEHGWESNDGYLPYQDVDRNIDIEAVSRLKHDIFDAGWSMYTSNRSQHIRYFLFCGKHNKLRRLLHSFIIWLVVK